MKIGFPFLRLTALLALSAVALRAQAIPSNVGASEHAVPELVASELVAPELVARIVHEGLENSRVMDLELELCSHGPRLTGSEGFVRASQWALARFAELGLDARFEKWGEWSLIWDRGQWSGRVVKPTWSRGDWAGAPRSDISLELQVATPAWTAGTKGKVAGALVRIPKTVEELDALRPRLAEVYLYGKRPSRSARDAADKELYEAFQEAVSEMPPLGFVQSARSTGLADRRFPNQIRVFGNHNVARGSWEKRPMTPEIVVRDDQADLLEEMLDAQQEVIIEFDLRNRFTQGPIELNNVIADLKGTEKPDEYVIVCGHLDSWHQAQGATDNGTGTTSTIEAARILTAAGAQPKRTIRFILWSGEEQGLLGSHQYVVMHRQEMDKISAVLNHDQGTNWVQSLSVTEAMSPMMEQVIAPVLALESPEPEFDGPVFHLRKSAKMSGGGGSDHASFLSAGVPAWSWGQRGTSSYGYGWHSQWDTYDIVVPEYQRHTATVIALVALGIANLPELLPREGVERGGRYDFPGFLSRTFGLELGEELEVANVVAGGAAARAGLQKGDRLTAVWGEPLETPVDMYRAWRAHGEDEKIEFTVKRGGSELKLGAEFADPAAPKADAPKADAPKTDAPKTDAPAESRPAEAQESGAKSATSSGVR